jgi:hypothetical protein
MQRQRDSGTRRWRWFGRAALWLGVGLVLLGTGCAQRYVITTTTGASLSSKGRPRLEGGWYLYRDATGQEQRINAMRVRSIEAQ